MIEDRKGMNYIGLCVFVSARVTAASNQPLMSLIFPMWQTNEGIIFYSLYEAVSSKANNIFKTSK